MGNLGRALAAYSGFAAGGFDIAALFDSDPALVGEQVGDVAIRPMSELRRLIRSRKITIGVITTPAGAAQQVCEAMVAAGVRSVLNFAPTVLVAPPGVNVRRVDLSTELHVLAFREMQDEQPHSPVGVAR
jgi:redox-sensing transcriptional repressor